MQRGVTHLLHEEVAELGPVGLLRVEHEGVLTLGFESGIIVPEMPVAALDGLLAYGLGARHAALDHRG